MELYTALELSRKAVGGKICGTGLTYPVLGEERRSDTWYTPLVLPDRLEFLWKIQNMEESHISEVGAGGSLDSAEKMQRMGPTPVYTPAGCLDFVHEPKLHLVAVM